MIVVLGGTLELSLLVFGLRLGSLGVHFGVFLWLWGQTLDPFVDVSGKGSKKMQKRREKKGVEMDAFSMEFQVFPENAKVRFDCAGASGLRFRPLLFLLRASIFALPFLHRFFEVFGAPPGVGVGGSAAEAGPP